MRIIIRNLPRGDFFDAVPFVDSTVVNLKQLLED